MGRARAGLTALALLLLVSACAKSGGTSGSPPVTTTTTTQATPSAAGYPLPKGQRIQASQGQTGTVRLAVGDVLAVYRPTMGTRPSGDSLVLAEVTDTQLIYQAVAAGTATLATDDPPKPPVCKTTPCPPSGAAPPVLTVEVTKP